jgi:hypothetical protein
MLLFIDKIKYIKMRSLLHFYYDNIHAINIILAVITAVMILIAIYIAIQTYRTTKHLFVLFEIGLFMTNNICFVLRLYSTDGTTEKMIVRIISNSAFLSYHWFFAYKYLKCSLKIPIEVRSNLVAQKTPIWL